MRVVGTAGHVDHGKSSLVKALTGIDPDRLAEEQARQLTIDLGFAWLDLPSGERVGVVDVPGHEDFIENMLAGVGGIDAAILVIAADEGVMPQTREHVAILNLLDIPQLIVAVSKSDLITDPDWLELVQLDIHEVLSKTRYADAPLVLVSAHTGAGLGQLVATLNERLTQLPPHNNNGVPLLPIDRVFTMSGFGAVVTGTLLGGLLQVGDSIEIQPTGLLGRIRGLQHHNTTVEMAHAGTRVAVNIAGVNYKAVRRGDVLSLPQAIQSTLLADVLLHHLPDAPRPLKHNAELKVFVGTSERIARVRLLEGDLLAPGQSTYAQLMFSERVPAIRYQHFIMRVPSPAATVGGGLILDVAPGRKWKRGQPDVMHRFSRLVRGTPLDLLQACLIQARRPLTMQHVIQQTGLSERQVIDLIDQDRILEHQNYLIHPDVLTYFAQRVDHHLSTWHTEQPLLIGMGRAMLQDRLHMDDGEFEAVLTWLAAKQIIAQTGDFLHVPNFVVIYTKTQQAALTILAEQFSARPYMPPSVKEVLATVGEPLFASLIAQGMLVQISTDVVLRSDVYREWIQHTFGVLQSSGVVTVATLRDAYATSRKYALAFLEHLDAAGLTRRMGDERVFGRGNWSSWL